MFEVTMLSLGSKESAEKNADLKIFEALMDAGFRVRICTRLRDLLTTLRAASDQVIVIDVREADDVDEYMLTSMVRSTSPGGILLFSGASSDERARGLNAGADACLSAPVEYAELVATLGALDRRLGANPREKKASPPASHIPIVNSGRTWTLDKRGWHLYSPGGRAVPLLRVERSFMTLLFEDPDRILRRKAWRVAEGMRQKRSLDVLVCSLRRKMKNASVDFPLDVWYGVGYQFSAQCQIIDETADC